MDIHGQKIVIIGGSSGIGLATAEAALNEGASVIIASRSEVKLEAANKRLGNRASTYSVDMADKLSLQHLFEEVIELDHLFVTPGSPKRGLIAETDMEMIRATMEMRFWGCYNATHFAANKIRGHGTITFMSGNVAIRPTRGSSVGTASVAAVEAFTRAAALELAPVRVNAIRAGLIDTPLLDGYGDNRRKIIDNYAERVPLKRVGSSEDVASAAIFLMKNEFTTGTVLHLDGGAALV